MLAAAWRLLRPGNALISAAAAALGAYLAVGAALPWWSVALAALASFAFAAAGNVRNDLGDVDVDRVAHPSRPLVTGAVSLRAARGLAVLLYVVALACGALVSWTALALVALAVPVMEAYERWGKAAGFSGNLLIGALTGAPFVLGALAARTATDGGGVGGDAGIVGLVGVGPAVLTVAALAALATVGREVLKDIEDERADRGARRTLPMRIGAKRASHVAAAFLVGAALLSPLPWLLETVLGRAYLPAVSVADACFLAAAAVGGRAPARGQRLAKLGMVVALLALLIGRWQTGGALP